MDGKFAFMEKYTNMLIRYVAQSDFGGINGVFINLKNS
jgi:hypothetical protein